MKRPLCFAALAFIAAMTLIINVAAVKPDVYSQGIRDGTQVYIKCKVRQKEISGETILVTISNITLNNSPNFQKESEEFQEIIPKEVKAICYFKEDAPPIGAWVILQGRCENFPVATNPGEFDRRNYYNMSYVGFCVKNCRLEAENGKSDYLPELLFNIKVSLSGVLYKILPEKEADIMKAMLLGESKGMDAEIKNLYKNAGIMHILAISGLHIGLIGYGIYRILSKSALSGRWAIGISILFIFIYGLMTGMGVSVRRAIIMFAFQLLAIAIGRSYDMLTALAIALFAALFENPYYIYSTDFFYRLARYWDWARLVLL